MTPEPPDPSETFILTLNLSKLSDYKGETVGGFVVEAFNYLVSQMLPSGMPFNSLTIHCTRSVIFDLAECRSKAFLKEIIFIESCPKSWVNGSMAKDPDGPFESLFISNDKRCVELIYRF
jgi:hypothetical protein